MGRDGIALPARAARGGTAKRISWGVGDQALSSLTNFALLIVAAHELHRREFGALALAVAAYTVALGLTRAMVGEPLLVEYSSTDADDTRAVSGGATATALMCGVGF